MEVQDLLMTLAALSMVPLCGLVVRILPNSRFGRWLQRQGNRTRTNVNSPDLRRLF